MIPKDVQDVLKQIFGDLDNEETLIAVLRLLNRRIDYLEERVKLLENK